ncbi:MAG TPA: hypothetical protein VKU41_07605 [Polyangiaceae bacterium]|nr:hypothetical protein [Polyangiaceae bacterium]
MHRTSGLLVLLAAGCAAHSAVEGKAGVSISADGSVIGSSGSSSGNGVIGGPGPGSGSNDTSDADTIGNPGPPSDGGTATNPDVGPPNVLPCNALGDAGGVFENITPPWSKLPAPPSGSGLIICGLDVDPRTPGTVYAGSSSYPAFKPGAFWRSTDCGATWTQVAMGSHGTDLTQGCTQEVEVDPITSDVYADSLYGTGHLYRSHNGGMDWVDVSPTGTGVPSFVESFTMDPTNHNHMVVAFHADCSLPNAPSSIASCLAETTDGANTWQVFPGLTDHWAEGYSVIILKGSNWISASYPNLYSTTNAGRYTTDVTKAWSVVLGYPGCSSFDINIAQYMGSYYLGCGAGLGIQTSVDAGSWMTTTNALQPASLVVTGKYMYAVQIADTSGQPLWRAPLSDLTQWEHVKTPSMMPAAMQTDTGAVKYDASHKLLYLSAQNAGLWRVQTE